MKLSRLSFTDREALRLGWPGALGVGLLVLDVAALLAVVQPVHERTDAAMHAAASLQRQMAAASARGAATVLPLEDQLAAFYAGFPRERDAADAIGRVAALALRNGLQLQQADYRLDRDRGGKLLRLQMSLPLRGAYPAIREFLATVRSEMRLVSLEQVQFERQKIGDAQVDARLRLVFYLEAAS